MKKRFQLFLSWDSAEYLGSKFIRLHGAKFTGSVLKEAAKINSGDGINLDVSFQTIKTSGVWEIAEFSWGKVLKQDDKEVLFDDAYVVSEQLHKFRSLSDDDIILINTENHEEEKHQYHFVYEATILNSSKSVYGGVDKRG